MAAVLVLRRSVRPFVLLFPGRVGSTYLVTALHQHPDVRAEGERLDALRPRGAAYQLAWADRFLRGPLLGRHRAVGFKTKLRDVLDPDGFTAVLARRGARVVVLGRRNDVKHAISRVTAKALYETTNRWNRYGQTAPSGPVHVDVEKFDRRLRRIAEDKAAIERYAAGLAVPVMTLDYEDLLADHDRAVTGVLDFLGVRRIALRGLTHKNTSDDLRDVVVNYDELRARYAGTPYETMFDDSVVT